MAHALPSKKPVIKRAVTWVGKTAGGNDTASLRPKTIYQESYDVLMDYYSGLEAYYLYEPGVYEQPKISPSVSSRAKPFEIANRVMLYRLHAAQARRKEILANVPGGFSEEALVELKIYYRDIEMLEERFPDFINNHPMMREGKALRGSKWNYRQQFSQLQKDVDKVLQRVSVKLESFDPLVSQTQPHLGQHSGTKKNPRRTLASVMQAHPSAVNPPTSALQRRGTN